MSSHEYKPRVVLVTGGSGLVGKGIEIYLKSVEEQRAPLKETWVFLSSRDADLTSYEQTKAVFDRVKPTHVIHLAAKVGGLFKNMRLKVEMFRDNIAINDNVLRCSYESGVEKVVSCLSTCIFPDKISYPINETQVHLGPPHFSNEGYAYAKRMIDVLNRAYHEEYNCNFTSVIPTNIYGPYDNYHLEDSHVIPGMIHKCYLAKKNGTDLVLMGTGKPLRQFVYSVDLGALLVWTLDNYQELTPLILSVGEKDEVSIAEVANMVAEAMDFKGKIVFDTSKADGQYKKTVENTKLLKLHPEFKFTDMKVAIKESVKFFEENYETARK
eukprot:TRINITY_DN344_c0_g1_i1.p1 TRINITY_DN344_c0_g1~~TRINITY_DN344_c0_g1_i1.p1  ORF type:complete len:326 (-),score=79.15 TRINITY_DN344_c0_g1_i1:113-1090(-)